jgi:hypothetical protein
MDFLLGLAVGVVVTAIFFFLFAERIVSLIVKKGKESDSADFWKPDPDDPYWNND